jgi:hypothetical protein
MNNMWYPTEQWSNPFNKNQKFDIILSDTEIVNIDISSDIDKIYVLYSTPKNVEDFLKNDVSNTLRFKIQNNKLKVVFIGNDSFDITKYDFEYIENTPSIFKHKNVQYWQTNYCDGVDSEQKLYVGVFIHHHLGNLLNLTNYTHKTQNHTKYFLTLNNKKRPDREMLYNIYNTFDSNIKEKIVSSFNFAGIFLEKELFSSKNAEHQLMYTSNILNFYKDVLFEVVSETGANVTEKIYKPLILGVPFILYNTFALGQINYFKNIGIDINYFNLDYTNIKNINNFILNLCSNDINILKIKYEHIFDMAENNRIKIYNHFNKIKTEIIKL